MIFNFSQLKNGAGLLEIPLENTHSVTVLVLFGTGSRYELRQTNGIAHFLEHMHFKGSKRYPSAINISETIDGVGGEINAFTSKEYTGYFVKVASEHGKLALDVLSDMLINPIFDMAEIDRERGVIIEELKMYEDQPAEMVGEIFESIMFGDTPLGWQTVGLANNIKIIDRNDFIDFRDKFYNAGNALIVLAGDTKDLVPVASYDFNLMPKGSKVLPAENSGNHPGILQMTVKKTEQTHLWFGYRTCSDSDADRYPLKILSSVLGGGMSSRLFVSVRERQGLAYYVRAHTENYRDNGYLVASAGVSNNKFDLAFRTILGEFEKIKSQRVSKEELNKAKEYLKGHFLLGLEKSDSVAEYFGIQHVLHGRLITPEEVIGHYESVTAEQIQEAAKKYLTTERLKVSIISPDDYSNSITSIIEKGTS